jgi:hypothetical protein
MWFGYTGESSPYYQHTFGVYYSEFEKGTYQQGSLPPGQYYPGVDYIFISRIGGIYGLRIGVDLPTQRVVYLFYVPSIPPRIPPR